MRVSLVKALPLLMSLLSFLLLDINAGAASAPARKLRVGVMEAAPFGMKNAVGNWEGIGVDLWRGLAKKLNLTYEFAGSPDSDVLLELKKGELDAVVGALVITPEREGEIEFSQTFYSADQAMGSPRKPIRTVFAGIFDAFFSYQFLRVFLPVLGILCLVGSVIFVIERKSDPEAYGGSRPRSLLFATLWSTGMMTGVGGKTPQTNLGRLFAILWILIGLTATSLFTATMTRLLTADLLSREIPDAHELPRQRVAVLEGTDHSALRLLGVRLLVMGTPQEVIGGVATGEADVCIMSEPVLKYYAGKHFMSKIQVTPFSGRKTPYAIGLAPDSPLRKPLNIALLEFAQSPEWENILRQYLDH